MSELPPRGWTDLSTIWDRGRPELQYLVPKLIGVGEVCLLAGAPESGKTMLLAAIAASVASGTEILPGLKPNAPARVLYVDEEIGEYEFVRRLRKLVYGMGLDRHALDRNLRLYPQQGYSLHTEERIEEFHDSVEDFDPKLIVVDTFVSVYGGDENDNSAVRRWFDRVVSPLRRAERSVVVSHHLNKEQKDDRRSRQARIRGATDLRSYPDKVWLAERVKEPSPAAESRSLRVQVHTVKARRGDKIKPVIVAFRDSEDRSRIFASDTEHTAEAAAKLGKCEVCKRAILERLRSGDGFCTRKVLREEIPGQLDCDTRTLNRALKALVEENLIQVSPNGKGLVTLVQNAPAN